MYHEDHVDDGDCLACLILCLEMDRDDLCEVDERELGGGF